MLNLQRGVLNIKLKQSYFGETLISNGVFYKKEKHTFLTIQSTKYENQYITTINKLNKQVIFDSMKKMMQLFLISYLATKKIYFFILLL